MDKSILIIADDFTGANDCAVQFKKMGLSTVSTSNENSVKDLLEENEVVSVNTSTRSLSPENACEAITSLCDEIRPLENTLIYKKVDSTLRGNLKSEIRALNDFYDPHLIVFAPAFPKQGRKTIEGVHEINGTPVHRTEFGRDVENPIRSSDISFYLQGLEDNYLHLVPESLDDIEICKLAEENNLVSFDVKEDSDLEKIARKVSEGISDENMVIWVGSAGLAEYVGYNFIRNREIESNIILFAVGSPQDTTRVQLKNYIDLMSADPILVKIDNLITNFEVEKERVLKKASEAVEKSTDIVLTISYDAEQVRRGKKLSDELELGIKEFRNKLNKRFGMLVSSVIDCIGLGEIDGLVSSGGDISISILEELDIDTLDVLGEVESGVPILERNGLKIVTKAGGFGTNNVFLKAGAKLKGGGDYEVE